MYICCVAEASEHSEPSELNGEPNGEPVWTAIHIRHPKVHIIDTKVCT